MRSMRLLAAATIIVALGTACGDGGGGVGPNDPPVASYTPPSCTVGVACAFTATPSTDDNAVTGWAWDFNGDATADATTKDASFSFAAAGSIPVRLIVSDAEGLADTVTNNVSVAPATPANLPPTASFDAPVCSAGACSFHSTSTDVDGTIAPTATTWDFGDPTSPSNTATGIDATHSYNVSTGVSEFTVTLTVTDDDGAVASTTQTITISAAANCQDAAGQNIACTLNLTSASKVTIKLESRDCQLLGNQFYVVAPIQQTIFQNGCSAPVGTVYNVNGPNADQSFNAGTALQVKFTQGAGDADDPPKNAPALKLTGSFPDWRLEIDDGGNAAEPRDFNDLILTVHAE